MQASVNWTINSFKKIVKMQQLLFWGCHGLVGLFVIRLQWGQGSMVGIEPYLIFSSPTLTPGMISPVYFQKKACLWTDNFWGKFTDNSLFSKFIQLFAFEYLKVFQNTHFSMSNISQHISKQIFELESISSWILSAICLSRKFFTQLCLQPLGQTKLKSLVKSIE